jgi:hypothetical protein
MGAKPFSLFGLINPLRQCANGQLPFVSSSINGQTKSFRWHNEQTLNGFSLICLPFAHLANSSFHSHDFFSFCSDTFSLILVFHAAFY